jgi:N-acetylneuraminate lyase
MTSTKLDGLIAATYTPMLQDGRLNLDQVEGLVEHLLVDGVSGFYVCGSTGEGMSLSGEERHATAEAYVAAGNS